MLNMLICDVRCHRDSLSSLYGSLNKIKETIRETSLENKNLRNCDYFAIITSCSHFTMLQLLNGQRANEINTRIK